MENIWQKLKKPIMVLAPMADVTDSAFRQVIAGCGAPDLFYTEFVSADGLASDKGRPKLLPNLQFASNEQPIVAQIFSGKPANIFYAAKLCAELGFVGVDINMGCPDKTIEKQCAGAALIKNPSLAKEIVAAAKEGVASAGRRIAVSVKTRIGYNQVEIEAWAQTLLDTKPASLTFHLRTRKEMSKVPARWDLIKIPVEMARGTGTLILGNGDVKTVAEAKAKAAEYGVDGVMLGRAIFGNPWLFSDHNPEPAERLATLAKHIKLFDELHGNVKSFALMKKHFKSYLAPIPNSADLRDQLMNTKTASEALIILESAQK